MDSLVILNRFEICVVSTNVLWRCLIMVADCSKHIQEQKSEEYNGCDEDAHDVVMPFD